MTSSRPTAAKTPRAPRQVADDEFLVGLDDRTEAWSQTRRGLRVQAPSGSTARSAPARQGDAVAGGPAARRRAAALFEGLVGLGGGSAESVAHTSAARMLEVRRHHPLVVTRGFARPIAGDARATAEQPLPPRQDRTTACRPIVVTAQHAPGLARPCEKLPITAAVLAVIAVRRRATRRRTPVTPATDARTADGARDCLDVARSIGHVRGETGRRDPRTTRRSSSGPGGRDGMP